MKCPWIDIRIGFALLSIGALLIAACGTERTEQSSSVGNLAFALSGTSAIGGRYRLADATFQVVGTSAFEIRTDDDPNSQSIALELLVGNYSITLEPGWTLQREISAGEFEARTALLLSPNPQPFLIEAETTTSLRFRFRADEESVDLDNGRLNIGIDVEETAAGPARQLLDDVNPGDLANWTPSNDPGNPVVIYEEIVSPWDGSTAIRARGIGGSYDACIAEQLSRHFKLASQASSDRARLWGYVALTSNNTYYNFPALEVRVYRQGSQVGLTTFYRAETTGGYVMDKYIIPATQAFEIGPAGYQAMPLSTVSPDGTAVVFDDIALHITNYLCVGENSVTLDALSLEY